MSLSKFFLHWAFNTLSPSLGEVLNQPRLLKFPQHEFGFVSGSSSMFCHVCEHVRIAMMEKAKKKIPN